MWPSVRSSFRILIFFTFLVAISPFVMILGKLSQALERVDPGLDTWLSRTAAQTQSTALHLICRFICFLFSIKVRASADLMLPEPKSNPLIVANHISYLDIIAIGSQFRCSFLAKEEVRGWPLIGPLTAGLGCLYLRREELSSRVRALKNIKTQLRARAVCVFPEGSTTRLQIPNEENWNTGQAWASLPDATQSPKIGRSIHAIGISYPNHESAAWVDDMAFLPHLFNTLKARSTEISIRSQVLAAADLKQTACARQRSQKALDSIRTLCSAAPKEYTQRWFCKASRVSDDVATLPSQSSSL